MIDGEHTERDDPQEEFPTSRVRMLLASIFNLVPGFGLGYYIAHRRIAFRVAFGLSVSLVLASVLIQLAAAQSPNPDAAEEALVVLLLSLAVLAGTHLLTAMEQLARSLGLGTIAIVSVFTFLAASSATAGLVLAMR